MNEEKFEKVIVRKPSQYDVRNLVFNLILTIIGSLIVLLANNIIFKILLGVIIFLDLFYFLLMILDVEIYWRRFK